MVQFAKPSDFGPAEWIKPAEHAGHLWLVTKVHGIGKKADDKFKNGQIVDVAYFNVTVLTMVDPETGQARIIEGAMVQQPGIVRHLKKAAGKGPDDGGVILGRVGQVDSGKGNPAWTLVNTLDGDENVAQQWCTAYSVALRVDELPLPAFIDPARVGQPQQAAQQQAYQPAPGHQAPAPAQQQYAPAPAPTGAPAAPPVQQFAAPAPVAFAPPAATPAPAAAPPAGVPTDNAAKIAELQAQLAAMQGQAQPPTTAA